MMPISANGLMGNSFQEGVIAFLLITISGAMVIGVALIIWGLWRAKPQS